MKEKNQNDILINTEQRSFQPVIYGPSKPTTDKSNKDVKINDPKLTHNDRIGKRNKFDKKGELIKVSPPDSSFTIICEKPKPQADQSDGYYYGQESNKKCCDMNCFGSSSNDTDPRDNCSYQLTVIFMSISFIVFPPLGLVLFFIFYLCTKNSGIWNNRQ